MTKSMAKIKDLTDRNFNYIVAQKFLRLNQTPH